MSRRKLSDDERALWEGVAKSARPLKKPRRKKIEAVAADAEEPVRATKPMPERPAPKPKTSAPPSTQMTRRERSRVARGRSEIDARLDLHGKTLAQAHGVLLRFLHRAAGGRLDACSRHYRQGPHVGCRGREAGALRREVPHWLALPECRALVLGLRSRACRPWRRGRALCAAEAGKMISLSPRAGRGSG